VSGAVFLKARGMWRVGGERKKGRVRRRREERRDRERETERERERERGEREGGEEVPSKDI
jgi:hypothetical protein